MGESIFTSWFRKPGLRYFIFISKKDYGQIAKFKNPTIYFLSGLFKFKISNNTS